MGFTILLNSANFHLILNHWPVFLPMIGLFTIGAGFTLNLRETRNVGLCFVIIGAILTIPTYFTGSAAQEIVQNYPEVDAHSIDLHRSFALYASLLLGVVGLFSLVILFKDARQKKIRRDWILLLLTMLLVSAIFMAYTAHVGGLIRHEELSRGQF
jgi:uncharacterized membrane protein